MALSDNTPRRRTQPHNDNGPVPPRPPAAPRHLGDDFIMGVRFFSRLPSGDRPHLPPDLDRIAMALPFASLVIGLGPALLLLAGALAGLPGLVIGGLAVGAAALVTGAMAEDALADAADGLFGGNTRERRLEIMKDSRHGTYGVVALCLNLLLRVAGLAALVAREPLSGAAIWLGLTVLARSGALGLTVLLPNARPGGIAATAGRVGMPAFLIGALFALLVGLVLVAPGSGVLGFVAAGAAMALVAWGWTVLCRRLIGGQTGDLIGALQALLELTGLVVVLLAV